MDYGEWLELLPQIIFYLVSGFSFYLIFTFTTGYKLAQNISETIFLELTIGFFLTNLIYIIPIRFDLYWNRLGLVCISALLGWSTAKIISSKIFRKILDSIGIHRTIYGSLWRDVASKARYYGSPIDLRCEEKDTKKQYLGQIYWIEENHENPRIALHYFIVLDEKNNILEDWRDEDNALLILQTDNLRSIEINYPVRETILQSECEKSECEK